MACACRMRIAIEESMAKPASSRKATNISLDPDLLDQARALDINISRACERGLIEQVARVRAERWRADNADAIVSSNAFVEQHDLPLRRHRRF